MDITIKQGEGISQALKRQLMSEYGVKGKQFNQDVWKKIQAALQDGKSTLTNRKAETKLIGDLWQPVTKNVSTHVNDVISIDDTTFKEILGFFGSSEAIKPAAVAEETKITPVQPPKVQPSPVVADAAADSEVKSQKAADVKSEPILADTKLQEEIKDINKPAAPVAAENKQTVSNLNTEEVALRETPDLETVIISEKKALTQPMRNIRHHDSAILAYKANDVLVDVANMEDKPDIETGQEGDYRYQISSLSNNRAIEVRTYDDGHRSVHVTFDKIDDKSKYLFRFEGAEVVYDIGLDGKTTMRIINSFGHDDSEEVDSLEIQQNEFGQTLNGLVKKIFCE